MTTFPSDPDGWENLTDEEKARRLVAARAVLTEAVRLVGEYRVAGLLLAWANAESH